MVPFLSRKYPQGEGPLACFPRVPARVQLPAQHHPDAVGDQRAHALGDGPREERVVPALRLFFALLVARPHRGMTVLARVTRALHKR